MRINNVSDPVYFPNSKGGPQADSEHHQPASWHADGEIMHAAHELHAEDDPLSTATADVGPEFQLAGGGPARCRVAGTAVSLGGGRMLAAMPHGRRRARLSESRTAERLPRG